MKFIKKFDRYITLLYFNTIIVIVLTSYFTFKEVMSSYNKNQHQSIAPLFSIITSEIIRPLNVAYYMANDPLLVTFVEQQNIDQPRLLQYLQRLSNRYKMLTFIALEKHDLLLDSENKKTSLTNEKAEWYQRLKRENKNHFADIGNADDPHLFFDMKLYNNQEQFIGFVGVAVDLNHFSSKFKEFSNRFGFELIFVDSNNNVTLSSNNLMKIESHHRAEEIINISELEWYQKLLTNEDIYQLSDTVVAVDDDVRSVSQMPIQELNWRLFIISPPVDQQSEYWQLFLTRMGIFLVTILVLYFVFITIVEYFTKRLIEDSETDFLTKLPNRSFIHRKSEELLCTHHKLCLVIADIDDFKLINDNYGHIVGDDVLKEIASLINNNLRYDDVRGRWGGEEFIMLLPDTSTNQALEIIERLRKNIAETPFKFASSSHALHCTMSFGISCGDTKETSLEQLLQFADEALYRAKDEGKNRIEIMN